MTTALLCTTIALQDGVLTGELDNVTPGAALPVLELILNNAVLGYPDLSQIGPGRLGFRMVVPGTVLSDGVQTLILRVEGQMDPLATVPIAAGQPLNHDLLAEIDLLRAELDMLKRAVRRQFGVSSY